MRHSSDKIANKKFVITHTTTTNAHSNLNKKLLCGHGKCKAATKKFSRMPAGSYKLARLGLQMIKYVGYVYDTVIFSLSCQ